MSINRQKRIFLSSTALDIPDIRAEIHRFLKEECEQEPVCFESKSFSVINDEGLHSHDISIDAIKDCDILLLIIDRRYGGLYSGSKYPQYKIYNEEIPMSITWAETTFAYDNCIPVYTFVRQAVWDERPIYKKLKKEERKYDPFHVDDTKENFEKHPCIRPCQRQTPVKSLVNQNRNFY